MGLDFDLWAEIRRKSDGKPVTFTKSAPPFHDQTDFHVFWTGDYDIMHGVIDTLNRCCGTSYDEKTGRMDVPAEALLPIYRYLLSRCDLAPDDRQYRNFAEDPDLYEHPLLTEQNCLHLARKVHDLLVDMQCPDSALLYSDADEHMTEADADDYMEHPEQYEWHFKLTNWW